MLNVALLSKWHVHAVDYAEQAHENPELSIEMIWDEDPNRGEEWAEELGVPFEKNLDTVLSNPNIDAVIVSTPTRLHKEVIIAAARYGKHIFTEKVLTFTTKDCEEMIEEINKAGVQFMISLPRLTEAYYLFAQQVIDEGLLGKLNMLRCRVAHNGAVPTDENPKGWLPDRFFDEEACGGGSLIDLGAHPIYLANRLSSGSPTAVTGSLHSMMNRGVDDFSVAIVEYDSGIVATLESSFISTGSPFKLELYGTEGTLLIEDGHIRLKSSHLQNKDWIVPENVPASESMPMEQWVSAITSEFEPNINKEDALLLTLINEAAALSHKSGEKIKTNTIR
ncbi:Gfo/Idh/MocA family protein [Halobacillus sp. BBL2006]|uniref:Gfo/Idh/MocA family protein n=1 Tax=Halobacillus sp. BBL2006 TaxID=1543706 RepID=UPI000543C8C5|nr:Gfo/Idh/MocA family oxidoreductase [Halobacillus sp. BBL2006]KHE67775.1 dehydrogenase [Halobacillus sp. BBL2006]